MVPQVKEVRREAHFLPLPDLEMLQERHIPILLERPVIEIAPQVPEARSAEIGIGNALCGLELWRWRERCRVQISIGYALVKIPAC